MDPQVKAMAGARQVGIETRGNRLKDEAPPEKALAEINTAVNEGR